MKRPLLGEPNKIWVIGSDSPFGAGSDSDRVVLAHAANVLVVPGPRQMNVSAEIALTDLSADAKTAIAGATAALEEFMSQLVVTGAPETDE